MWHGRAKIIGVAGTSPAMTTGARTHVQGGTAMSQLRLGVIGIGAFGARVALRLLWSGYHTLSIYDVADVATDNRICSSDESCRAVSRSFASKARPTPLPRCDAETYTA